MQKCENQIPGEPCSQNLSHAIRVNISMNSVLLALFDKTLVEREEPNRSAVISDLVTCWIYFKDGSCDPACPNYEEEEDPGA